MTSFPNFTGPQRTYFQPLTALVSTTDATATTIFSVVIPPTTTLMITADVAGRRTGGSSGTAEDGAAYKICGAFKNVAGVATIIGQTILFTAEDQAAWTVAFAVTADTALLKVTGAANNNINWTTTYQSGTRVS